MAKRWTLLAAMSIAATVGCGPGAEQAAIGDSTSRPAASALGTLVGICALADMPVATPADRLALSEAVLAELLGAGAYANNARERGIASAATLLTQIARAEADAPDSAFSTPSGFPTTQSALRELREACERPTLGQD